LNLSVSDKSDLVLRVCYHLHKLLVQKWSLRV